MGSMFLTVTTTALSFHITLSTAENLILNKKSANFIHVFACTSRIISHPVSHALDDASVLAAEALCDPRLWLYEGDREQIGLSEVRFPAMFALSATL